MLLISGTRSLPGALLRKTRQIAPKHIHGCSEPFIAAPLSSAFIDQRRSFSLDSLYAEACESAIVKSFESSLINVHDTLGLPWWGVIALSAITLRTTATLPLAIYSHHVLARLANLEPEVRELNNRLKAETAAYKRATNITEKQAIAIYRLSLRKRVQELIERENCHPAKATVTVCSQIPLWISLSLAIRNISNASTMGIFAVQSFQHEGLLHVQNLIMPDSTFIIPISICLVNLMNVELYTLRTSKPIKGLNRAWTNGLRVLSIVMVPIAAYAPSGLSLYWLVSALTALAQNLTLMSPSVRRLCRIPITPKESPQPYRTIIGNLRNRFSLVKSTTTK